MTVLVPTGVDAGAVWHYGDPYAEQKALAAGQAGVDLSQRPVFTVAGPDRLTWLHAITTADFAALTADFAALTADFAALTPGVPVVAYILNPQGHLMHVLAATDDGERLWCHTEPGHEAALLAWLNKMVFAARVELSGPLDDQVVVQPPGGAPQVVALAERDAALGPVRAGLWAAEALRIAAGLPRIFLDTDERTIPNELANPSDAMLGPAVRLDKGCYPGQEAVARTYNLGRPPRRLTLLQLDGSADALPAVGAEVLADGVVVGRMGSSERHYEFGPTGLALLKRSVPVDAELIVDGIAAAQEVLVDPDAGLHYRPGAR